MVLRTNPGWAGTRSNNWGPWTVPRPKAAAASDANAASSEKRDGMERLYKPTSAAPEDPRSEMVHYNDLDEDYLVIKVHASGMNYPDLSMCTHVYQTRPAAPFGIGLEAAGEVIHV